MTTKTQCDNYGCAEQVGGPQSVLVARGALVLNFCSSSCLYVWAEVEHDKLKSRTQKRSQIDELMQRTRQHK